MSPRLLARSLLPALWLAACADPARAPAHAALRAADAAVLGLAPHVVALAPDEVRLARVAREVALAAAARGDWSGARDVALAVPEQVRAAERAASTRKLALDTAWARAQVDLPNLLYALEDRLDALDDLGALPPGVDRPALSAARGELDAARSAWDQLARTSDVGDGASAVDRAAGLRTRVVAALHRVGLR
jgi:hypothetical protein